MLSDTIIRKDSLGYPVLLERHNCAWQRRWSWISWKYVFVRKVDYCSRVVNTNIDLVEVVVTMIEVAVTKQEREIAEREWRDAAPAGVEIP